MGPHLLLFPYHQAAGRRGSGHRTAVCRALLATLGSGPAAPPGGPHRPEPSGPSSGPGAEICVWGARSRAACACVPTVRPPTAAPSCSPFHLIRGAFYKH